MKLFLNISKQYEHKSPIAFSHLLPLYTYVLPLKLGGVREQVGHSGTWPFSCTMSSVKLNVHYLSGTTTFQFQTPHYYFQCCWRLSSQTPPWTVPLLYTWKSSLCWIIPLTLFLHDYTLFTQIYSFKYSKGQLQIMVKKKNCTNVFTLLSSFLSVIKPLHISHF